MYSRQRPEAGVGRGPERAATDCRSGGKFRKEAGGMERRDTEADARAKEAVVIARGGVPGQRLCPACAEPRGMILLDEAAALYDVGERTILRWLEARAIHYRESPEGFVFICLRSLL